MSGTLGTQIPHRYTNMSKEFQVGDQALIVAGGNAGKVVELVIFLGNAVEIDHPFDLSQCFENPSRNVCWLVAPIFGKLDGVWIADDLSEKMIQMDDSCEAEKNFMPLRGDDQPAIADANVRILEGVV